MQQVNAANEGLKVIKWTSTRTDDIKLTSFIPELVARSAPLFTTVIKGPSRPSDLIKYSTRVIVADI